MDMDEIDPPRPSATPANLQSMSIKELKDYIGALETEIERVRAKIAEKESIKSGADGLFRIG